VSRGRVVPDVLAAVDLGSNSFHMVVARHSHGQLVILDRLREMVRLAAGLGDSGRLDDTATDRALRCLERFGQRLRAMHADSVRVVGTNALRRARRKRWFLERARAALGHPIEIISGLEEARLIYSGVAHTSPMSPDKRLVIDIGGGSTEVVIGEGFDPLLLESFSTVAASPRNASSALAPRCGSSSSRFRRPIEKWAGCTPSAAPARFGSSAMCCTN
jgi:exopolyphosphatase / guanosine-5'-triphosphate,3'-diphosphate pyrophosphatase